MRGVKRVFQHGVTDSTSERAFAALEAGQARHGDVHVARKQTAGRGSRGRRWFSPAGGGLYASVILKPPPPAPSPVELTMAAGLAVRDLLLGLGVEGPSLKWPNDVLIEGDKVCGILVEARGLDPRSPALVCGIGLNLGPMDFPEEVRARGATSLDRHGVEPDPERVLEALLSALERRWALVGTRSLELAADFAAAAGLTPGRAVRVRRGDRAFRGPIVAFGTDGLVLDAPDGRRSLPLEHITALEWA